MNIKDYISSGIIESYVLGITNTEESQELELLASKYPEVRAAIDACEAEMNAFAEKEAVIPPPELKNKIWQELQKTEAVQENNKPSQTESLEIIKHSNYTNNNWIKYLAAASVVGLIISLAYNISYKKTVSETAKSLTTLQIKQDSILSQNHLLQMVAAPNMQKVVLAGVPGHTEDSATVYWDNNTKEVYLAINKLPIPSADKQYQLWAIVDGKPIDAGLYNTDGKQFNIQKLKTIPKAQMFAITLEPKGGSVAPTLSQMYVAGKI